MSGFVPETQHKSEKEKDTKRQKCFIASLRYSFCKFSSYVKFAFRIWPSKPWNTKVHDRIRFWKFFIHHKLHRENRKVTYFFDKSTRLIFAPKNKSSLGRRTKAQIFNLRTNICM